MALNVLTAAGTQTAAGVDLQNFILNCMVLIFWTGAASDGSNSMQYSILDSADNTTFAASASLPTVAAVTATNGILKIPLDTRNVKRYIQVKALTASTTATFITGACVVGLNQVS
jgi:hypothetical protein